MTRQDANRVYKQWKKEAFRYIHEKPRLLHTLLKELSSLRNTYTQAPLPKWLKDRIELQAQSIEQAAKLGWLHGDESALNKITVAKKSSAPPRLIREAMRQGAASLRLGLSQAKTKDHPQRS